MCMRSSCRVISALTGTATHVAVGGLLAASMPAASLAAGASGPGQLAGPNWWIEDPLQGRMIASDVTAVSATDGANFTFTNSGDGHHVVTRYEPGTFVATPLLSGTGTVASATIVGNTGVLVGNDFPNAFFQAFNIKTGV